MLPEDDRVIETCRSVLNVLMFNVFRLLKFYIYIYTYTYTCTGSTKKMYTHFNERRLRCIIDYCKSTIYFRQHNNMMYVFTSI